VNITVQLTDRQRYDEMCQANVRVNRSSRVMGTDDVLGTNDVVVDGVENTETHTAQYHSNNVHIGSGMLLDGGWLSGNGVMHINEVAIRRARLVLGWVTVSGFNSRRGHLSRYVTSRPGQLSLAIHSWVVAMSTRQKAVTLAAGE